MPDSPETVEVDFVGPRHLAGGGDPAWVTVPLHRACHWSHGNEPLRPRVVLNSPDQRAELTLAPQPRGQWWTLHHAPDTARPAWYASFGAQTPVELVAAVTDALTDPATAATAPCDPYTPLQQSAWTPARAEAGALVSPDGTVHIQRLGSPRGPGPWFFTTRLDRHRPVWQARFSEHTPTHLITAFTAALCDPKPVARIGSWYGSPSYPAPTGVTVQTTDVLVTLVEAALEERVQSLAARRIGPPAGASPLRQPPDKHSRRR
ncbi:DUF317 domain-containing protein [Streptomyces sp. NPDC059631]|uniref:DUF317 domain-containing protein n=1 Tax=unclassified Streptomyces TaxID=2593676 RepID=UPI0036A7B5BD